MRFTSYSKPLIKKF